MRSYVQNIFAFILIALLISGCRFPGSGGSLTFAGTVEVTEHALSLPVAARLESVSVEEGQTVHKDQLLACSDRFAQTKKDYERLETLYRTGGTDLQTLEHAHLAVKDQCIESPVDGEVLVKVRQHGETVSAGSPIVILGQTAAPWVKLYIPENKVQQVRAGQKAHIRLDGTHRDLAGEVFYISPKAEFTPRNAQTAEERVTQTFLVKVRFLDPSAHAHPGVFADVRLETAA